MQAWAGLGYYSRARNLHACAKAVVERARRPLPRHAKRSFATLPGIGAYTAAAIAAIAFDEPDRGGRRQCRARGGAALRGRGAAAEGEAARSGRWPQSAGAGGAGRRFRAGADGSRRHDLHAEAPRLRALPVDGALPRRGPPACRRAIPRKEKKAEGTVRRGAAFVVLRADDAILLRTRPPKGLLGGMAEVPTSAWEPDYEPARAMLDAPLDARWQRLPGTSAPRLHAFSPRTHGLPRQGPPRHRGARRHALDPPQHACRGGAARAMRKVLAHALEGMTAKAN